MADVRTDLEVWVAVQRLVCQSTMIRQVLRCLEACGMSGVQVAVMGARLDELELVLDEVRRRLLPGLVGPVSTPVRPRARARDHRRPPARRPVPVRPAPPGR
ncbi:hypothetical protein FHX34_10882 [Actinoplanes teichomyceticus]|uniref:Uncharacterized protein n=1 Tax=Actinoplanes teichomyceticus TaxID=1867 RepID=A0A561VCP6_ACTTI|nr:hypothetical protein FHX34_10882 [Actinoplanes teichomyceticus]